MSKKIFISHSSKDKVIVKYFIDDILGLGLSININDIFCTSADGAKIDSGNDWREAIKNHLKNSKITILIITSHYKESEICQNEMGASWVLSGTVLPFIIEPINYENIGILQEPKQIENLINEKSLDRLKDRIQKKLNIPTENIKSDKWTSKKREFLIKTNNYLSENPFQKPLTRDILITSEREIKELNTTIQSLIAESARLKLFIEKLEKLKNKKDIDKVEQELNFPSSKFKEFELLCEKITKNFQEINQGIYSIVFSDFTGKSLPSNWREKKEEYQWATARNFIDSEGYILKDRTPQIKKLLTSLNNLSDFLNKNKVEILSEYEKKYDSPLDITNLDFWEELFIIHIY